MNKNLKNGLVEGLISMNVPEEINFAIGKGKS